MAGPAQEHRPAAPAGDRSDADPEVVVVGAGPAGLLLAGDLAAAGVSVTVLEQRDTTSNLTRAFAVHARTLELLDARGLADDLVATGRPSPRLRLFGGVALDFSGLPSRFPFVLITPQYATERLLQERAQRCGATFRRGARVTAVRSDEGGVTIDVRTATGRPESVRSAYVVAADGVGSTVRACLGLPFRGRSAVRSVVLADVRLGEEPADVLVVDARRDGFAFLAPFGDGWWRVIAWDRADQEPDTAPVDIRRLRELTRRVLGTDYGMHDARWVSRFHSDERQVPTYRSGRVLLVGDAAHVHSPAGGQGMNTGLQDAANLSWRLAATVRGWAPAGVLDGYDAERRPVGRAVLRGSGTLLRLVMLEPAVLRAARNTAGRLVTSTPPLARRAAGLVSGLDVRYPSPPGGSALAGTRAPDVQVVAPDGQERRLYEVLRSGRFVLVRGQAEVAPSGRNGPSPLRGWADRVEVVTRAGVWWVLVRPDGYVAQAGAAATAVKNASVEDAAVEDAAVAAALRGWCGEPTEAGRAPSAGAAAALLEDRS